VYLPNITPISFHRLHDRLVPNYTHKIETMRGVAKAGADLLLFHMFYEKGTVNNATSRYDPKNESILKIKDPQLGIAFIDTNEATQQNPQGVPVNGVALLGSNFLLWRNKEKPSIDLANVLDAPLFRGSRDLEFGGPEPSEIASFAVTLQAKSVLDGNGIPSTVFYMPSDLPSTHVDNLEEIRRTLKQNKDIDRTMRVLLEEYGYGGLGVVSNEELRSPAIRSGITSGKMIWYALESEFRSKAGRLLEKIVKNGLPAVADEYYPGGNAEWKMRNAIKKQTWEVCEDKHTYYIHHERKHVPFDIPIGVKILSKDGKVTTGPPKCALIGTVIMQKMHELGFSHLLSAFHSGEAPIASAGFFLGKNLLGLPTVAYTLSMNPDRLTPEVSGMGGVLAFRYPMIEPIHGPT
jgi:hypothetical protein